MRLDRPRHGRLSVVATGATTENTPPARAARAGLGSSRLRRTVVVALAIVTALMISIGVTAIWLRATTMNTPRFVDVVGDLGSNDKVQTALADYTAAQLEQAIDAESVLKDRLPPRAQPLAAPLSSAIDSFLARQAQAFFHSDAFERLWRAAVERAHRQTLAVLRGETNLVSTRGGKVELDLIPVLTRVLQRVDDRTNGALSKRVPAISEDLTADEARARLEAALDRPLPSNFGEIVVFEDKQLKALQRAVQWFQRLVILLAVLAVVLIALTVLVAPDRRRVAVTLGLTTAFVLVLFRAVARAAGNRVVARVVVPENREAARAIVNRVLASYLDVTVVVVVAALLVAAIAYLAGPGRTAEAIRRRVARVEWIGEHATALAIGVLVIALAVLLFANLTLGWLAVLAILVVAIEIVLLRLRTAYAPSAEPPPAPV